MLGAILLLLHSASTPAAPLPAPPHPQALELNDVGGGVAADCGAGSLAAQLANIYNETVTLPEELLQMSRVGGSKQRLYRFAEKLVSGQPVNVVVIGGSVSEGAGVHAREHSYVGILFAWILNTFPHSQHRCVFVLGQGRD